MGGVQDSFPCCLSRNHVLCEPWRRGLVGHSQLIGVIPVIVLFLSSAPAMAPQNVQVTALTASQLEVTWDPPPPESQNGNIQGYKASSHALWALSSSSLCAQALRLWLHTVYTAGLLRPQPHRHSIEVGRICLQQAWWEQPWDKKLLR